MDRITIYVPGINTWPGASKNWSGRAVTFTHGFAQASKLQWWAEKVEYYCNAISRVFGQKDRAQKLYRTLFYYSQFTQKILVGHSNGADVILTMMQDHPAFPHIDALHLVCGATEADFNRNGLNTLLTQGRVGSVFVYIAGKDMALKLAHTWAAKMLGYGVLGLHGPWSVAPEIRERVTEVKNGPWIDYGHSDCWSDSEFSKTMGNFLRP